MRSESVARRRKARANSGVARDSHNGTVPAASDHARHTARRFDRSCMAICSLDPSSGESSKLDRIQEIVEDVAAAGEKIVVFSYLLAPLRALRRRLEVNWRVSFLEGGLGVEERDQAVEAFRMDPEVVALLSSLRVGGEGLTLTEANHVAFINEWWNPSANIQARDRVVRIGQKRTVLVYRFLTANTVEEALARILKRKDAQFQALIGGLASPEGDLSPDMALALSEHMRRELQQPFLVGPPGG